MTREWAELAVNVATFYAAGGVLFAFAFVIRGARRVDPAADGAGWGFRLAIFPGAVALWPILALRWWRAGDGPPTERTAHREVSR